MPRRYMPLPTVNAWIGVSNEYNEKLNLPNSLGAIDGKHVEIKYPKKAGSIYYCHKHHLIAVTGPDYSFLYTDVGAYGSEGDSTVFRESTFGKLLAQEMLPLPLTRPFFGSTVPFYFVGDYAFPLCTRIMKPYTRRAKGKLQENERQFNYRLSRARRCVENSFGILSARWYCLARMLPVGPNNAQANVNACCVLHNFLIKKAPWYCPPGFADSFDRNGNIIDGKWRHVLSGRPTALSPIETQLQGRTASNAVRMRNHLKNYVCSSQGILKWQESYA